MKNKYTISSIGVIKKYETLVSNYEAVNELNRLNNENIELKANLSNKNTFSGLKKLFRIQG